MNEKPLKIMVLAGGPDRERPISLQSGETIAHALSEAGHHVQVCDPQPGATDYIEQFNTWPGDVVFPALHGAWGEGGPLQEVLEAHGLPFVGSGSQASRLCIDKDATKRAAQSAGVPTAPFEMVDTNTPAGLSPPVVVKPPLEGSSIDVEICKTPEALEQARRELHERHDLLLIERYIDGIEVAFGVIADPTAAAAQPLPPIQIVPATESYDYEAKYVRDDTQYRFDIDLDDALIDQIRQFAVTMFGTLGCRDLARVDFMLDRELNPFLLEVNTLPGFTSHSLLPMAAAHAGIALPGLVDELARCALAREKSTGKAKKIK